MLRDGFRSLCGGTTRGISRLTRHVLVLKNIPGGGCDSCLGMSGVGRMRNIAGNSRTLGGVLRACDRFVIRRHGLLTITSRTNSRTAMTIVDSCLGRRRGVI